MSQSHSLLRTFAPLRCSLIVAGIAIACFAARSFSETLLNNTNPPASEEMNAIAKTNLATQLRVGMHGSSNSYTFQIPPQVFTNRSRDGSNHMSGDMARKLYLEQMRAAATAARTNTSFRAAEVSTNRIVPKQ